MKWSRALLTHAFYQCFIALDQLVNTLLGVTHALLGFGSFEVWADETLSSRCGRLAHRWPYKGWRWLIDLLFRWQGPDHCYNAFHAEREQRQHPPEARC